MTQRIGLFGGTFDPPHLGHVAALVAAWESGRFSRIVVTVAGDPYLKSAAGVVRPATLRLAMAHAAFDHLDGVEVSDLEIRRTGPSYTIDTVAELRAGGDPVDLIVGADLVGQLTHWHRAEELASQVEVGVVPRPGSPTELPEGFSAYVIEMNPVDLSSTFVRAIAGNSLRNYVPEAVIPLLEGQKD